MKAGCHLKTLSTIFTITLLFACGQQEKEKEQGPQSPAQTLQSCTPSMLDLCRNLEAEIAEIRQDRDLALQKGHTTSARDLTHKLGTKSELLELYRKGLDLDSQEIQDFLRRQATLNEIIDGQRPAYNETERQEVEKVRKEFGDFFLTSEEVDGEIGKQSIELTNRKPWSGYWYPFRGQEMFAGEDSPLVKFDEIITSLEKTPGAAAWEANAHRTGQPWESSDGLCDAWALASALHPEPLVPIHINGIRLTPSQIKGLMVQKYAQFPKKRYGIPYQGFLETDGLGQDIRPEAFHHLVRVLLAENRVPIVDTDPNFPVWNMPIFRYDWSVEPDPEYEQAYIVTAQPWFVRFRDQPSDEPTRYRIGSESDIEIPFYRFRLFVDSELVPNRGYRILYGEWLKDDLATDHPDTVYLPDLDAEASSRNPYISDNIDIIDQIIEKIQQ